ncbi:MAG TPA: N-acetylglutaminylglutamine amidotransferase [Hyphomicrobiales bacterium]|nr:N-acetylglutaminylglutamine amidotransferase [Hyphomicrobiales bacterium]
MCGLCGEVHFDDTPASLSNIDRMADVMRPRGPDGGGALARGRLALGHRRLRIIDLSEKGHQPMDDPALGLSIAFNGCIYNYPELREELKAAGHSFFSHSDTEVILKAYAEWGTDCVTRFNGMFAFAIVEHESGRLVLARDRLGIKPLYLSPIRGGKGLRFASSLPALAATGDIDTSVDPVALHHYMSWHAVVPAPFTILKGVRKLPPATLSVIEPDGSREDRVFWDPPFTRQTGDGARSAEDCEEAVHEALLAAVKRRMVADVPVGVLLSGGVDSSLVVGLLAEAGQEGLNTFSIGFESVDAEEGNEFRYSDVITERFATRHHKIAVGSDRMMAALPSVIQAMSEPMVSHDNVGFYLLSEEVSKHVKVVQSGQGADEIFAGYHWYPPLANSNDAVGDYAKAFFDRDHAEYCTAVEDAYQGEDYSRRFVEEHFAAEGADTPVDRALRLDSRIMLTDDPVKRVDNMTMAWGLEARVPFLDHEVVELAARVPPDLKLADGGKGILKAVARRVIPSEVIDRPKGYFPVPALKYLEGSVLDMVRDALTSEAARKRGLFKPAYVETLLAAPKEHITPLRGSKLWQIALLELWLQQHLF